jgi:AraC-like DNA-binding protein
VGYGVGGSQSFNFDYEVLGLPIDLGRRAVVTAAASPMYEMFRRHLEHVCVALDGLQQDGDALQLVGAATMDLARALLATTSDQRSLERDVLHSTELTRIRVYIDQHLQDTNLNLVSIANANHVSLRQLYKVWGSNWPTPSEYIMGERLRRAHDDLASADLTSQSVFAIARKWGFTDSAHFSRRFKGAYGITPREWRQLNQLG